VEARIFLKDHKVAYVLILCVLNVDTDLTLVHLGWKGLVFERRIL
jgi:hypothetical protein